MHVCFRKDIRWKPGSVTVAIVESDRYSMVKVGDIVVACNDRRDPESIQRALQRRDMARCLEIVPVFLQLGFRKVLITKSFWFHSLK